MGRVINTNEMNVIGDSALSENGGEVANKASLKK